MQYISLYNWAFLVNGFAYYFSHINDIIFFCKREIAECSKRSDASCGTNLGMQLWICNTCTIHYLSFWASFWLCNELHIFFPPLMKKLFASRWTNRTGVTYAGLE